MAGEDEKRLRAILQIARALNDATKSTDTNVDNIADGLKGLSAEAQNLVLFYAEQAEAFERQVPK